MDTAKPEENYKMTEFYLAIVFAVLIILITYLLSRRLKKSTNVVLFTGLSDSGKTAIFTRIVFNKPQKSVTSLKENEATLSELNLKLVDLPGADRLRSRHWENYRASAKRVIFVLDSTTVDSKLRELSEYLYVLLSDGILYTHKIQFTIACNKQDLQDAKNKNEIKSILEKELNAIMDTKKGQLGKTSDEVEEDYIAKQDFKEINLDSLKVDMIETSVGNLEQLMKLIF